MTDNRTGPRVESRGFEAAIRRAIGLLSSDPSAALEEANKLAAERPDPRAFRLAAAAYRTLDRTDDAAEAELRAITGGFPPELQRAVAAREAGRMEDSKAIAEEYLRTSPDDLLAKTIAAEAAIGLRQDDLAEGMLRQVVARAPAFLRAAILLANILTSQSRLLDSIDVIEDLHARLPQDPTVIRYLADLRAQKGDAADAARLFAQLTSLKSPNSNDLFKHAQNLRAAGRKAESLQAIRGMIGLFPEDGRAWWMLAQFFPEELRDDDVDQIRGALAHSGRDASNAGLFAIAASIIDHRKGNYEAAFEGISLVKDIRRPRVPYDPDSLTRHVDELIAGFTSDVFSRRTAEGSPSNAPIFVVGMPRSGSTLVERILGRHSMIEATGEIQVLPRLVAAEVRGRRTGFCSLPPAFLSDDMLAKIAGSYLERARHFRRTDKPLFVDKFNANWIHAGLIRLMFPHAKILDVRRSALDCCWSVFKMMFGDAYANDQRHLGRYFADYARCMKAIDVAAPGGILSVRYESLVDDVERETRRILSFVGVGFERECTDFHLSNDPVATPSSEQVRRPLFREGIGSAEPYRRLLSPLIEELGNLSSRTDG